MVNGFGLGGDDLSKQGGFLALKFKISYKLFYDFKL